MLNVKIFIKTIQKKIVRYVETGVQNYVKGRYGSQSSENAIIGYVLSGDIPTIVGEIEKEIKKRASDNEFNANVGNCRTPV